MAAKTVFVPSPKMLIYASMHPFLFLQRQGAGPCVGVQVLPLFLKSVCLPPCWKFLGLPLMAKFPGSVKSVVQLYTVTVQLTNT